MSPWTFPVSSLLSQYGPFASCTIRYLIDRQGTRQESGSNNVVRSRRFASAGTERFFFEVRRAERLLRNG